MKIRELLTDESKWTKGTYARDEAGYLVNPMADDAYCFCLSGAIIHCYGVREFIGIYRPSICKRIGTCNVATWNDAPERTFAEVKALVEELDI